jgi:hypothetical protein
MIINFESAEVISLKSPGLWVGYINAV